MCMRPTRSERTCTSTSTPIRALHFPERIQRHDEQREHPRAQIFLHLCGRSIRPRAHARFGPMRKLRSSILSSSRRSVAVRPSFE